MARLNRNWQRSDNTETEEKSEETQKEQSDDLSLDESNGESDDTEEGQEKESVAVDIEQEMEGCVCENPQFQVSAKQQRRGRSKRDF